MQSPVPPPYSIFIWTAVAVLALGLFAGMSLLALDSGGLSLSPSTATPAGESPELSTPDVSSSGALNGTPVPPPNAHADTEPTPANSTALAGLWLSAVSAITALIGLVSSLWLGWRKEGREAAQHRLELEKMRLEIRKLEEELANKEI